MAYLLKRTDRCGGFVAKSGRPSSYTNNLRNARKFDTREEAEANRCVGNEIVLDLEHVLGQVRGS